MPLYIPVKFLRPSRGRRSCYVTQGGVDVAENVI